MSKQFKSTRGREIIKYQQSQTQDLDLRLERHILLSSQAQRQLLICQSQLNYCQQFLGNIKQQHNNMSKHYLLEKAKHFGGWQSKLKQLTSAATLNDSSLQAQNQNKIKNNYQNHMQCSQKNHLTQILNDNIRQKEEEQISQLKQKLEKLYDKIRALVSEQYMNDKIFIKIKRQTRKASKSFTIQHLDNEIAKYQNWVNQNNTKITNDMICKEIEEKLIHNLQMMKLLMKKKIINNDYIYEQFEDKKQLNEAIMDKVKILDKHILSKFMHDVKLIKQKSIQSGVTSCYNKQSSSNIFQANKILDLKKVILYITDIEDTIEQIDTYNIEGQLQKESNILSKKLNSLNVSFKK